MTRCGSRSCADAGQALNRDHSPRCGETSPALALTLPDDRELLNQLCDEERTYRCGPAGDGEGCGDDTYHLAQGWAALIARLRELGWKHEKAPPMQQLLLTRDDLHVLLAQHVTLAGQQDIPLGPVGSCQEAADAITEVLDGLEEAYHDDSLAPLTPAGPTSVGASGRCGWPATC